MLHRSTHREAEGEHPELAWECRAGSRGDIRMKPLEILAGVVEGLTVGEIASRARLDAGEVDEHLAALRVRGLISRRADGSYGVTAGGRDVWSVWLEHQR